MSKSRSEVALKDRWNVEALYPNLEKWQAELTSLQPQEQVNLDGRNYNFRASWEMGLKRLNRRSKPSWG